MRSDESKLPLPIPLAPFHFLLSLLFKNPQLRLPCNATCQNVSSSHPKTSKLFLPRLFHTTRRKTHLLRRRRRWPTSFPAPSNSDSTSPSEFITVVKDRLRPRLRRCPSRRRDTFRRRRCATRWYRIRRRWTTRTFGATSRMCSAGASLRRWYRFSSTELPWK